MNPFKKDNFMLPIASINSVYVDNVIATELFSPKLLINEIDNRRLELNISNKIPSYELLFSFNVQLANKNRLALEIANKYAKNLTKIIITLKKPSKLSVKNRTNWNSVHWSYWEHINRVYLVGGLTSKELNSIFYVHIKEEIINNNIDNFEVVIVEDSANYGTLGLIKKIDENESLVFDFGQSFIKRLHVNKNSNKVLFKNTLKPIISKHLKHTGYSKCDLKASGAILHKYIVEVITNTINEVNFTGNNIYISIANYIFFGKIYESRGGYAKLHYSADNYQEYLNNAVSESLNRDINVYLYHDTTAMALMFEKNHNEAVISLGTGFGISFLD